ncbi:copper resistance protein NlpE [Luteimonas composti]|uniref:Copper resistance protein NlpE n=1 Tax=Luteimonas composti TaxID=398257 RepID=A0ABT6MPV6_9GAMM|nr:copper resistance protein NlpE [Luteimonas composti]MDH7452493.1 copper resistance protein NlpE [Luteimonas composti]
MRLFRCLTPTLALALAACAPDSATAPAPGTGTEAAGKSAEAALADPMLEGSDASAVVRHDPQDPQGFDRKAFAGRFAGILPCADCPGIEMRLEIASEGTFALRQTYQARDTTTSLTGTWTVDEAGKRLLLDPDSKDEADRVFEIVSRDELRALDASGRPIDSTLNYSLRRN